MVFSGHELISFYSFFDFESSGEIWGDSLLSISTLWPRLCGSLLTSCGGGCVVLKLKRDFPSHTFANHWVGVHMLIMADTSY